MPRINAWRTRDGRRSVAAVSAVLLAAALGLTACSGSDDTADDTAADGTKLTTVTLALDYLPNAAHNGLAYAMQEGLFEKQGIKIKLIPFNNVAAETLLGSNTADVGFSGSTAQAATAMAAGTPIKAIFNVIPHDQAVISVLASSGITRPAELSGKTYGGYGSPGELSLVNGMVEFDGGKGDVKQIVLSVGSYEALKAKQIDTAALYADQLYEFDKQGLDVVNFKPSEYGIPPMLGTQVVASDSWLEKNPDVAKGFVAALQEGYQKAIDDPETANKALEAQFDDLNPELVDFVSKYNAENLMPNPDGPVGTSNPDVWQDQVDYLISGGLLVGEDGKTLDSFDVKPFVTNDYLPAS